tara:strand:+ start:340 stop:582 length:243 start_codon:yes stop_codon:yes gene_type:complete
MVKGCGFPDRPVIVVHLDLLCLTRPLPQTRNVFAGFAWRRQPNHCVVGFFHSSLSPIRSPREDWINHQLAGSVDQTGKGF